jgi:RHS repeat-associated protein
MPNLPDAPALGNKIGILAENRTPDDLLKAPPAQAGDPVDLYSGIMTIKNTDIGFGGARGSLAVVRTYRSLSSNPGPFGIGTGHNYGLQLDISGLIRSGEGIINLVMPDGNYFSFYRTITGTFINTSIPAFAGAVFSSPSSGVYNLRYKNGTTYTFQTSALGGLEAFLTSITDSNGNTVTITLNPAQPLQVTQVTDPIGRTLTFNYDSSNRITSITDPIGRSVQYNYNTQGTLATMTDPAGGITRYTYDSNNNMLTFTDPRGILQAQNTLDSNGRVIQQLRPDGGVLTFTYAFLNPLVATSPIMQAQVTDSNGVAAIYRFNPTGFVTDITATQGQTRNLQRTPGTNQLAGVIEASSTQTNTYDSNGNVLSTTDQTGITTQFTYNPTFNKVASIVDALGNTTRFTYDASGNLLSSTDADGNTSTYQYNSSGLLTQTTDALNQTTTFAYDYFGNLTSTTDPLGNSTSYNYDGISRLILTQDALGRRTSFTYDPLGRLLTRTDAKTGVTTFTYDQNGNLLSVKDARGNTTMFAYDVMNRLTTRTDALGRRDTRSYDTNGNLLTFTDRRGQTSIFSFDSLNRLVGETYSDSTVARTYDVLGRLAQVNDSASGIFTFSYDLAGRVTSSSTPIGTVNYGYDGRGFMAARQVVGQSALSYTYDAAGNLASAALPQASASFNYNPRNQLSKISRANGVSSTFGYDSDARLLTITHAAGTSALDAESYSYDAVGNRSGHSTSIGQSLITQPTTNQYNVNNELTFGSTSNSYDGNGNLLQQGTAPVYSWDSRNRLKSIAAGGQTTNFTYDFAGNLLVQADSGSSLNLTKTFVLDNATNVAYESASDTTSYSVLSGRSIDSHLAIAQSNGQVQYGLSDAVNNTIATVNQSGVVNSQFYYEAYGQTTTTGNYPFQFTGRTAVSGSLYFNRARFYNASVGRFITEDPIGFSTGDSNLYRYARNSPMSLRDPYGYQATSGYGPPVISGPGTTVNIPYSPPQPPPTPVYYIGPYTPPIPPLRSPYQEAMEEYWICRSYGGMCMPNGGEAEHTHKEDSECLGEPVWINYGPVP